MHYKKIFLIFILLSLFSSSTYLINSASADDVKKNEMFNEHTTLEIQPVWDNSVLQPITPPPAKKIENSIQQKKGMPKDFMITISPLLIDFGELSPTNPLLREMTISIANTQAPQYQVFAYETSSPKKDSFFIPDTSCDNNACTENIASVWANILTYGYGYRCDNQDGNACMKDFRESNYYKQFASQELGEIMEPVMEGGIGEKKNVILLTYKLNIAGSQRVAAYTNSVTYILAPGF